jgi:hypothetical protein
MRIPRFLPPLAAALLAVSCAGLGLPATITLGEADLQKLIERHFPLERRFLDVLEVTVSTPWLRLLPEDNRLATTLEVSARDRLFGGNWHGRLALESSLRFDSGDQTLRLRQVRVDEFALDNAGAAVRPQAERLGALVAERVLEDLAVYRIPAERLAQMQRLGLAVQAVMVTARGVELTLAKVSP